MITFRKVYFEEEKERVRMEYSKPAIDQLFDEVSHVFWIVLLFYVIISMIWIMYCCCIHRMELNLVEKKIEENGMATSLELQRLLNAYNKITADPSAPSRTSIIIPTEQV